MRSNRKGWFGWNRGRRGTQETLGQRCQWRHLIAERSPRISLSIVQFDHSFHIHQNLETSGFYSVSIVFWTSFVARDLYRQSSSTIELGWFDVVLAGDLLIEMELRNDENVDFFIVELFRGAEDEEDVEGDADDDGSSDDVCAWLGRFSESLTKSFHNCLILRSAVVRSLWLSTENPNGSRYERN